MAVEEQVEQAMEAIEFGVQRAAEEYWINLRNELRKSSGFELRSEGILKLAVEGAYCAGALDVLGSMASGVETILKGEECQA